MHLGKLTTYKPTIISSNTNGIKTADPTLFEKLFHDYTNQHTLHNTVDILVKGRLVGNHLLRN